MSPDRVTMGPVNDMATTPRPKPSPPARSPRPGGGLPIGPQRALSTAWRPHPGTSPCSLLSAPVPGAVSRKGYDRPSNRGPHSQASQSRTSSTSTIGASPRS